MALTIDVDYQLDSKSGARVISGTVLFDASYVTGGETMDLSSYFSSSTSPNVVVESSTGYQLNHDRGTASAGKIIAYYNNVNAAANAALVQVANAANLSTLNCTFIAMGQGAL